MRKYILYSALFAAIGISVSACNDYDPEIVEYETTEGTEGTCLLYTSPSPRDTR